MGAGTSREESWTWPSAAGEHAGMGPAWLGVVLAGEGASVGKPHLGASPS